jgi:hypothetical protein
MIINYMQVGMYGGHVLYEVYYTGIYVERNKASRLPR